jgi:hypothetical protein
MRKLSVLAFFFFSANQPFTLPQNMGIRLTHATVRNPHGGGGPANLTKIHGSSPLRKLHRLAERT